MDFSKDETLLVLWLSAVLKQAGKAMKLNFYFWLCTYCVKTHYYFIKKKKVI